MEIAAPRQTNLGDTLVRKGILTPDQLDQALAEKEKIPFEKLAETLKRLELVEEEELLSVMAEQNGIPYLKIEKGLYDPDVFDVLPKEFIESNLVLPLFKIRDTLTMAVPEPLNIFLMDSLKRLSGLNVNIALASPEDLARAIRQIGNCKKAFLVDDIIENIREDDIKVVEREVDDIDQIEAAAGLSPVVRLVNFIIYKGINEGASDVHIEPDEGLLRVRYRVDGLLREGMRPPVQLQSAVVSRIKIMSDLDIAQRRIPQDGRMQVMMNNRLVDLRISILPTFHGEKVVIRILDKDSALKGLDKLGFGIEMLEEFSKLITKPNGIILVTGPTGSGKTTTLYSSLRQINSVDKNISTVENPIEYNLKFVNQVQINERAGLTFSGSFRSLLRQDPDIILVGEIRDKETAQIAVQASLTGHLVLSTLHTNDSLGVVTRLINMGVEPFLISSSLSAALAQRLVRKICPACREQIPVTSIMTRLFKKHGLDVETVYEGKGCSKCGRTGYAGRVGVYELLTVDDDLRDLVVSSPAISELREYARSRNLKSLRYDALRKVREGLTTIDEVTRISEDTF